MLEVVIGLEHSRSLRAWAGVRFAADFQRVPANPILATSPRSSQSGGLQNLLSKGGLDQLDGKGSRGIALVENGIDFDHFQ